MLLETVLSVIVVKLIATTPFNFEGTKRLSAARSTLKTIEDVVFDTTVFNNDTLLQQYNEY